ncbi:MAG: cytochrome c maturation protein CcmE [Candidatus Hydrothermarchaeaceae archaeon]
MDRKTAKRSKLILGVGVIFLFIVIGFSALDGFVNPYKTVSDVVNHPQDYTNRHVQVEGYVVKDSVSWTPPVLKFAITDGENQLDVRYEGALPGSFPVGETGSQSKIDVVVIGSMADTGEFTADQILVKCPSKYEQKLNESSAN